MFFMLSKLILSLLEQKLISCSLHANTLIAFLLPLLQLAWLGAVRTGVL